MFFPGDKVMYKTSGVCVLEGTVVKGPYGAQSEYYVLRPLSKSNSAVFVPCDNEALTSNIRGIMTVRETEDLIDNLKSEDDIWEDDDRVRAEMYRNAICNGDRLRIGALIRTLISRKQQRSLSGKKLYAVDERLLSEATGILCGEIAASLSVSEDEALNLILGKKS